MSTISEPLTIDFKTNHNLTDLVYKHGLVKINNHNIITKNDFINFAESIGEILEWEFGLVNELIVDANAKNYLYSNEHVPFHWDGAFYKEPGILLFHCIKAPDLNSGGETLFTDTTAIYNKYNTFKQNVVKSWENISIKYKTDKITHYGGEFVKKLINKHPVNNNYILRYAEEVTSEKNPVSCEISGIDKIYINKFIEELKAVIYNDHYCYTHIWENNDILLVDNHRMIHGRNAIKINSPRHIRRIQII